MWYYVKNLLFSLAFLFGMGLLPYGIETLKIDSIKLPLNILNILFFFLIMGFAMYKEGEESRKRLKANDIERKRILQTGELRPIKRSSEYRGWKGFFMGALVCSPLILTLLVHAIIYICGGTYEMIAVVGITLFMGFFMPYIRIKYGSMMNENLVFTEYFACLYVVPLIVLVYGIAYILGARKVEKKYRFIEERTKMAKRG